MKVVDLHPDDLLDKDARGELSEVERTRLEAHLERCDTCRFEREVRADFADELADDGDLIPSQRILALMEPSIPPPPAPVKETEDVEAEIPAALPSIRPSRMRRNLRVALLVAAALMVGSAATANGAGVRVWAHVASVLSLDTQEEHPTVAAPLPQAQTTIASRTIPLPELTAPEPTEEPAHVEAPAAPPPVVTVSLPVETPANLFEAANKARNAGDYGRSITLHRKLETTYPASREAHVSYATLGRLLLDRGDPIGALEAFDAYQKKGPGPMDEAVLVGRATSLERLGRDAEARATWNQLLTQFPDTPYREHAESRLKGSH
jgi:hypothetical protein